MAVLLVTYDFRKETSDQDREKLRDEIKRYSWARLSESSYAIDTTSAPETIFNILSKFMDANDYLLVITLKRPYAGRNAKEVIDWLEARLTY